MSRRIIAGAAVLGLAALVMPAVAQDTGPTGTAERTSTVDTSDQEAAGAGGSETATSGDSRRSAMRAAEQAGIQEVQPVEGAFILEGISPNADPIFMIVGADGELLALAAPLGELSQVQPGSVPVPGEEGAADAAQAGQPTQSGSNPRTQAVGPSNWDPAAVEGAMQGLQRGSDAASAQN